MPIRRTALLLSFPLLLQACSQTALPLVSGEAIDWRDLQGQWVLVNYWAQWCEPCREEIPELNQLDQAQDIRVLGVNFDGLQDAALQAAVTDMGIQFSVLNGDPAAGQGWQTPLALPATLVINPQGELLEVRFGPQTEAGMRQRMQP